MAEGQSKQKSRLIDGLVVVFVLVTVGLLVVQLGLNVLDTLAQANQVAATPEAVQSVVTATPGPSPEPSPTFDISSVEISS